MCMYWFDGQLDIIVLVVGLEYIVYMFALFYFFSICII